MTKKETEEKSRKIMGKLMCILRDHKSVIDQYLNDTRLHKSQHRLLMCLSNLGKNVSQRDLAEHLNITPAAVAVTLKKLDKDGIITKKTSEEDNRFNEVELTDKGKKIVKESQKIFQCIDERIFDGFSEEELVQLESYLDRVQKNISKVNE